MPRYWAAAANPTIYRIEEALQELEFDYWTVNGSKVSAGDYVIIWKTLGKDKNRGIISLGRVETDPIDMKDASNIYWINQDKANNVEKRVKVRYISKLPGLPLWVGGDADNLLLNLNVAKSQGGTVFTVTQEQWEELLGYLGVKNIEDYITVRELKKYEDYSREEVHNIFSPNTVFTPRSGTWGIQGIVNIPNRPKDYVFFVTFGQQQGDHVFDECITRDGVLSWQSQPQQSFSDRRIQKFIKHDELMNSIYLFLRTSELKPYTYLGKLKYLLHDRERQNPVYFQWQILDWQPEAVADRIGLILQDNEQVEIKSISEPREKYTIMKSQSVLTLTNPPLSLQRRGTTTQAFKTKKTPDYSDIDARNKILGLLGEDLVVEYEKSVLTEKGKTDLAAKVRHVSKLEGDGAGYDIESYTTTGEKKFIEVKTTRGGISSSLYMSSNELEFIEQHKDEYFLYRVYEYDSNTNSGKLYIIKGQEVTNRFSFTPTHYRVALL